MKSASETENYNCLLFVAGGQRFAVDICCIERIEDFQIATALPFTPSYYQGVVNIQGQVLPQICLATYFSLVPHRSSFTNAKNSLKVFFEQRSLLIAVDEIEQQIAVAKSSLKESSEKLCLAEFEYDNKPVFLLDCEALLDLLAVKKTIPHPAREYIQQQSAQEITEATEDYILIKQGKRCSAVGLAELDKIIELKSVNDLKLDHVNVFGLTVSDGQSYLLHKQADQKVNKEKQLALVPHWGEGSFALLVDELASLSIKPSQIRKQGASQQFVQYGNDWYQLDHTLRQELESDYKLLGGLIPSRDKSLKPVLEESLELLLFQQAGKFYAVGLPHVYRVLAASQQTSLPEHDTLKALIAVGNETIPVYQPLAEFGSQGTEYIILFTSQGLLALAAEKLINTLKLPISEFKKNQQQQLIEGWFLHDDCLVTVLNPPLFSYSHEKSLS